MPTVHVFGAAGFAGAQLTAYIDGHPTFDLGVITARGDAGRRLVDVAPQYRVERVLQAPDVASTAKGDFAAVAYPHAEAAALVSQLVDRGVRVLDVSADHRLRDGDLYPPVYGFDHPRPDLLAEAVYGLPERYREGIADARVVANPGCFPEASILALLPLEGHLEDVVIDSKSGVSGAGRTPTETVHYSMAADNVSAYKVYAHRHTPEIEQELGVPVTFTPHLVPVDRGLLSTCYARVVGMDVPHQDDLLQRYADRYAGHPFVEVVERPPGMRAVQRTNFAQVCPMADPRGGRVTAFGVIDNLGKGAAGQAVQNLNIMAGLPETEGLLNPLARADWLRVPEGLAPVPGGSVATPAGYRAAGVAAGLKPSGLRDVGILVADGPTASAMVNTTSALPSAPVIRNRTLDRSRLRAVVVNAGKANAATGSPGLDDAHAMAARAAAGLGLDAGEVAVCSTGTIGERLDMGITGPGIDAAVAALSREGGGDFGSAICTTDRAPKAGGFRLALPGGGEVAIGAAAKGAGMIRPDMATMLAYVTTDAAIDPAELQRMTAEAATASFNRISVNAQMSPSDTLLVFARREGATLAGADRDRFAAGLACVCRWLAVQMVKDGEGAEHAVRVLVRGARDDAEAERVARAVGESSLVKTAVFGRDPNWGRISQAVGQALAGAPGDVHEPEVTVDGVPFADPRAIEVLGLDEYDLEVALGRGDGAAELWASDLGHAYVTLNAEYHT